MSEAWRSFRVATWLGWQIESNWTDIFLFFVYSIIKPVASAMILVVMHVLARALLILLDIEDNTRRAARK